MFVAMPGVEPVPAPPPSRFHESNLWATPIRDLGLTIAGTPSSRSSRSSATICAGPALPGCGPGSTSRPSGACRSTLSPSAFRSIWPGPISRHCTASRSATSKGSTAADILRYLRHEMGHVVNYAYRLYDDGGVGQAVRLDHAAVPRGVPAPAVQPPLRAPPARLVRAEASRRGLVRDLRRLDDAGPRLAGRLRAAGPGRWRSSTTATASCRRSRDREPVVTSRRARRGRRGDRLLARHYYRHGADVRAAAAGLDGDLRAIFDDLGGAEGCPGRTARAGRAPDPPARAPSSWPTCSAGPAISPRARASWSATWPTAPSAESGLRATRESAAIVAFTTFVTALAMNHVQRGSYLP